jgi:nucleoside-diphosphate-sugar epimerase
VLWYFGSIKKHFLKILIVGGKSSLGIALKEVLGNTHEVITAGRFGCDIAMDLANPLQSIIIPFNTDVVIHAAASFGGKTPEQIIECESVNVLGTAKLCNAALQAKTRHFIFISSIFTLLPVQSDFYNIYAISKKQAEELASYFCALFSIPLTILRPSQIYGSTENFRKHQPFFYSIIDKAVRNEDIMLYGNHDALRNYIYIDDLVEIISLIIQKGVEGVYSCAHPENISYSTIAKSSISAFESKSQVFFLKDKPNMPDNVFEWDSSIYDKIDFIPRVNILEGMRMIRTERERHLTKAGTNR